MRECGGCAAKVSPETLAAILRGLVGARDAEGTLVGLADADDASVVRLDDDRALITTVDACPPMVDDPEQFGAIAAANAVGDVLAMGGRVLGMRDRGWLPGSCKVLAPWSRTAGEHSSAVIRSTR